MTITFVSQEEFDATVKRMEDRAKAVKAAERIVAKSKNKTLEAKIAAKRILAAAKRMEV